MSVFSNEYENETGEKATYRKDSSDFHTLRYVNWLENKLKDDRAMLEEVVEIMQSAEVFRNHKIKDFLKRAKGRGIG